MAQSEAGYRAFLLNKDGKIASAVEIMASDDATAYAEVQALLKDKQEAELWQEKRRLGVVQASPSA